MAFLTRPTPSPPNDGTDNLPLQRLVHRSSISSCDESQNEGTQLRRLESQDGEAQSPVEQAERLETGREQGSPEQENKINLEKNKDIDTISIWNIPLTMVGLLLLGLIIGVGHHLCYNYLDGKPVARYSQAWILRIATGAAFIVKMVFAIAVGIALSQVTWFTLRQKYFKIGTIDKIFTLQTDLLSFLSRDLLAAPLILIMAAVTWIFGIITILVPSTLSITFATRSSVNPCEVPVFGTGSPSSLTVWQAAPGGSRTPYGGPSPLMSKMTAKTIVGDVPIGFPSPCGRNCSYSVTFPGPAMSCDEQPFEIAQAVLGNDTAPDNQNGATFTYYSAVADKQHEEILWVLFGLNEYYNEVPTALSCSTRNTTYSVNVTFGNGIPTSSVTTGNLTQADNVDWGAQFNFANWATSEINATTRRALDMVAVRDSLYDSLVGSISMRFDEQNAFESNTSVTSTDLIELKVNETGSTFHLNRELKSGIPELMQNITLSVMGGNRPSVRVNCTSLETELVYQYRPLWLLVSYLAGFGISVLCVGLGLYSLMINGLPIEDSFSQILVTTRNPALHEVSRGHCLSSKPAKRLKAHRVKFGELKKLDEHDRGDDGCGSGHAAFGLEGQVIPIRKGRLYD
ncbi:hypothetical protein BDW59DRAFT_165679 [Aspergillus cavernicola]|uniref:Uncharacterized protein n=1 Tax=Aspergillus cavernicola TaxID=176166 RepID=A0ABR4HR57_9EURO